MRILITGGCGFIGHHFVQYVLEQTHWEVVVLDKLSYAAGGYSRLRKIGALPNDRVAVFPHDLAYPLPAGLAHEIGELDYIAHLGAASHVDRSIANPVSFVEANVLGTTRLLQFARTQQKLQQFLYFSTDEVFGPAADGMSFGAWDRYNSCNPYAASKAGGEEMCLAFANTYDLPVVVTHSMNVFGERQHAEKFIPLVIGQVLRDQPVAIHTDPQSNLPCTRSYLYARRAADAVLFLLLHGAQRQKYNIPGDCEIDNLSLARKIAAILNRPLKYRLVSQPEARPGNDRRYSVDGEALLRLGWSPRDAGVVDFDGALEQCVRTIAGESVTDQIEAAVDAPAAAPQSPANTAA